MRRATRGTRRGRGRGVAPGGGRRDRRPRRRSAGGRSGPQHPPNHMRRCVSVTGAGARSARGREVASTTARRQEARHGVTERKLTQVATPACLDLSLPSAPRLALSTSLPPPKISPSARSTPTRRAAPCRTSASTTSATSGSRRPRSRRTCISPTLRGSSRAPQRARGLATRSSRTFRWVPGEPRPAMKEETNAGCLRSVHIQQAGGAAASIVLSGAKVAWRALYAAPGC